ncbi:HEPN domain-containing protein [Geobacter sp.]|uniref:HEPN domain-containing protein n=1 Tax=Geobacter sp. TaxID=46610 RepID=UPI0027BAFD6D|nr:HEPN domain-containing protein [Geobacter sp.]
MKNEYRTITREWLAKAESDLAYAQASYREFDDFHSQMCILCHDAAEKFLKALLASSGTRPERTHDLVTLHNECLSALEPHGALNELDVPCRLLNRYYVPLKYPSHYPAITKVQASQAIEAAERIRAVVNAILLPELDT